MASKPKRADAKAFELPVAAQKQKDLRNKAAARHLAEMEKLKRTLADERTARSKADRRIRALDKQVAALHGKIGACEVLLRQSRAALVGKPSIVGAITSLLDRLS